MKIFNIEIKLKTKRINNKFIPNENQIARARLWLNQKWFDNNRSYLQHPKNPYGTIKDLKKLTVKELSKFYGSGEIMAKTVKYILDNDLLVEYHSFHYPY